MPILDAKPKVAVLLAAYQGREWINEQVTSILSQELVDVTLYISVDLSTDGTYEWCVDLSRMNNNVYVLDYGEKFGGAAKNFFRLIRDVDFSGYDYVSLSDQDDIWLTKKIYHAIELIKMNHYDACSSDVIAFWGDGRERLVKKSYPQKKLDYHFEAAGPGCTYVFTSCSLVDFKVFILENFDEVYDVALHDWLIYAYFRHGNYKWCIDAVPLMFYRQHAGNQVGFNFGIEAYIRRLFKIRNKWYRREVIKINNLLMKSKHSELTLNYWFLVNNFWQLRRRTRDAFVLLLMIVFGFF